MDRRKRHDWLQPPVLSTAKPSHATFSGAGDSQLRKGEAQASRVIETASPAPKKSKRGASHREADKGLPLGSQAIPPSIAIIPPSPAVEVFTLIEDYVFGNEGKAAATPSPTCRRKIDFVVEPSILEAPQPLCKKNCSKSRPRLQLKFLLLSL